MKTLIIALLTAITIAGYTAAADLTGTWELDVRFDDATVEGGEIDCTLQQSGAQLKGTCSGDSVQLAGDVKGQDVTWRLGGTGDDAHRFTGTVDDSGTHMKGPFTAAGKGGSFTAVKSK
jgi:hypothetical protein